MPNDHPLFIYRYMDRVVLQNDSARFRNRVAAAFTVGDGAKFEIGQQIQLHAGIMIPMGGYGYLWGQFWAAAALPEVLTAITVAISYTRAKGYPWTPTFLKAVRKAMLDENLGLRIDDVGIVHLGVDENFEVTRLASLAALDDPRLKSARDFYESAYRYMDAQPPNTRSAIKAAFEAVEVLAVQLVPRHRNLNSNLCRTELKEACISALTADPTEKIMLAATFDSMAEWVQGVHHYRHPKPDVPPPTMDTTVLALTLASGFLRVLARVGVQVLPKA